jgi:cell division transport system ATP-binding protein
MIRLENVTKVYSGDSIAVRDVSLDITKGEFVFLVGPSGSGKSTLIRMLLREEDATRGQIWVAGKEITSMHQRHVPRLRRSIGTVFQDFKLLPNKTVFENVAFALEVLGQPRQVVRQQTTQVLDLVGLAGKEDRLPTQLSGGEQQRVSVARAFVNRPPILLADEPTGNLDPATSVGIMRLLDRINRTGTTIVMATHDHAIVDAMRRRVVALDGGRVMQDIVAGRYEDTMVRAAVVGALDQDGLPPEDFAAATEAGSTREPDVAEPMSTGPDEGQGGPASGDTTEPPPFSLPDMLASEEETTHPLDPDRTAEGDPFGAEEERTR